MNKIFKFVASFGIIMSMMVTMCNTNVFAAEVTTKEENITVMETQGYNDNISGNFVLQYTDDLGDVSIISFDAHCVFGVQWDEGCTGWVTDAVFSVSNTTVNGVYRHFAPCYDVAKVYGSSKIMDYSVTSNYKIRVMLSCDEWGEVTLSAYRV